MRNLIRIATDLEIDVENLEYTFTNAFNGKEIYQDYAILKL